MNHDSILLTEKDYARIRLILNKLDSEDFENLEQEIEGAHVIREDQVPSDLVTMNSEVKYLNIQDGKESKIKIVYPEEANSEEGKISVLAPLAAALIGLRKNQEIDWNFPDGKTKTLKVLNVTHH